MSSSKIGFSDISALHVAMDPARRMETAFEEISADLCRRHDALRARGSGNEMQVHHGRIWGWTFFKGPGALYVGYGVYFAPLAGDMLMAQPPLPEFGPGFIAIGSDEVQLDTAEGLASEGWHVGTEGWYLIKPVGFDGNQARRFQDIMVDAIDRNFDTISSIASTYRSKVEGALSP